jgi:hypothetical protein
LEIDNILSANIRGCLLVELVKSDVEIVLQSEARVLKELRIIFNL